MNRQIAVEVAAVADEILLTPIPASLIAPAATVGVAGGDVAMQIKATYRPLADIGAPNEGFEQTSAGPQPEEARRRGRDRSASGTEALAGVRGRKKQGGTGNGRIAQLVARDASP